MIKNMWYAILDSKELKGTQPIGVTRFSEKLVLYRTSAGRIHCLVDKCCHRGAALSAGKTHGEHIACPFHGFVYDGSGKVVRIPANGLNTSVPEHFRVNTYEVRETQGLIWLWYGDLKAITEDPPWFDALTQDYSYGGFSEVWEVHYSRAIENQLDVVHLPFVHETTIGRGCKTLVNGPVVKWEGNRMTFYVDNVQDHGQMPLKPDEIVDYEKLFHLEFQMPNTWRNVISDQISIFAAFVPIDETHTKIYLRFYQRFMRFPVLKSLVNLMSNIPNRKILHQDRRVVLTQDPKKSELMMHEKLIQGDLPIISYRQKRHQLQINAKSSSQNQD